jgi:hypothetical protein
MVVHEATDFGLSEFFKSMITGGPAHNNFTECYKCVKAHLSKSKIMQDIRGTAGNTDTITLIQHRMAQLSEVQQIDGMNKMYEILKGEGDMQLAREQCKETCQISNTSDLSETIPVGTRAIAANFHNCLNSVFDGLKKSTIIKNCQGKNTDSGTPVNNSMTGKAMDFLRRQTGILKTEEEAKCALNTIKDFLKNGANPTAVNVCTGEQNSSMESFLPLAILPKYTSRDLGSFI